MKPLTVHEAQQNLFDINLAVHHLEHARNYLKRAGAVRTLDRVRSALKSAEGAGRHAYANLGAAQLAELAKSAASVYPASKPKDDA